MSLFDTAPNNTNRPLADLLRPQHLNEVVGQDHLFGEEGVLTKLASTGKIPSLILWGPPGCGKTTIARLLSQDTGYVFKQISAIFSGVAELRKVFDEAKHLKSMGSQMLLFVDEIHRFNKSQQDGFLPYVEDGTIVLVGATTENPSFELNAALLSRCQVLTLHRLDENALRALMEKTEAHYHKPIPLNEKAKSQLLNMADGDGRYLLTSLEQVYLYAGDKTLDEKSLQNLLQKRAPLYDKGDDAHYNLISALHKSVRGSDPDAALYWFARMIDGGEDPRYLARRMIRMASEDIGLADSHALTITMQAADAYERLGSPEGELTLAHALVYLATAPKSNAVYTAYKTSVVKAKQTGSLLPPKHILNAPTNLMKDQGYGDGYIYDHDTHEAFSGQNYFPDGMKREKFYKPVERGFERDIIKRLEYWQKLREKK